MVEKAATQAVQKLSSTIIKQAAHKTARIHAHDAAKWAMSKASKKLCVSPKPGSVFHSAAFGLARKAALKGARAAVKKPSQVIVKGALKEMNGNGSQRMRTRGNVRKYKQN